MRVLTYTGQVTSPTWLVQHSPATYESLITNTMIANGWGVENLRITVNWITLPSAYNYTFTISLSAPDNENIERVKQAIVSTFSSVGLQTNTVALSNDTAGNSPYIPNDGIINSISQSLGGLVPNTNIGIAGLSVSTMILLGVGLIAIFALKNSPTSPVRYFRR